MTDKEKLKPCRCDPLGMGGHTEDCPHAHIPPTPLFTRAPDSAPEGEGLTRRIEFDAHFALINWEKYKNKPDGPYDEVAYQAQKVIDALTALRASDRDNVIEECASELVRQYDLNDCDERAADDALEIPIRDLRALKQALKGSQT